MTSFDVEMLRSEAEWFPHFLSLCQAMLLRLWSKRDGNPMVGLLESILTVNSYRQVGDILSGHDWIPRQTIYSLGSRARLIAYYPTYVDDGRQYRFYNL